MSAAAAPNANIARHLALMAAAQPARCALKVPRGRTGRGEIDYLSLSFAELDAEVAAWCERLTRAGIRPGDRTLVMVRQGLPLIAAVFALFRSGAVPVVIDPGMGLKTFLACVERSRPTALVGIPLARLISRVFRRPFATVRHRVGAASALTARLTTPGATPAAGRALSPASAWSAATDLAAILFTSGSTGTPKGVCYEHGMFEAQVALIRDAYAIQPGEIDLPLLPIFALFNPALGMTTIVPELDPRRPAALDPARIVQAINQEQVTNSFGSPTLWRKIGEYCRAQNLTLPTLRRVLCAGAAVPADLWQASRAFLPNGRLHSPYGATEALPIASISSDEIEALAAAPKMYPRRSDAKPAKDVATDTSVDLKPDALGDTLPFGACVGRPLAALDVRIIAISDDPIADLADAHELSSGEIGEIIVRGPMVTQRYDANPAAIALAKIADRRSTGAPLFHRLGDCGYLDAQGRLWFCGRKAERVDTFVGTLHTEPCEQVFRQHPRARRCALIGIGERGRQRPAIVIETKVNYSAEGRALARELRQLALQHERTATIKLFYFREKFPVDVRHNAKIHRLTLARWARTATGYESDPKR